jgi:hypothetical protein
MGSEKRCSACGRTFETLSRKRLHECEEEQKKQADHIELAEFGFTKGESWPFVAFRVEMESGTDSMGKFDLAFAAYSPPDKDEPCFAFIDADNEPIATVDWNEDIREWLLTVLTKNGYTTCINYEGTDFVTDQGDVGVAILGRKLGLAYDWVERDEPLPSNYQTILPDIIRRLDRQTDIEPIDEERFP